MDIEFLPFSVYCSIDRAQKGYINGGDLSRLLVRHFRDITDEDVSNLMDYFQGPYCHKIGYNDFTRIILPYTD